MKMELVTSFIIGFISMWFISRTPITIFKQNCPLKNTMLNIASNYGSNEKICNELKRYSMVQIQHGNYEYVEVIYTIKRQTNDKART
jgi:hypothetical protein